MKNIKKDIPSLLGLIGTTSLAFISTGVAAPAMLGIVGTLSTGVASNLFTAINPDKIKKWFVNVHPDDLNHSIQKLFVQSVVDALGNINILYSESGATSQEKKEAKQLIKQLQKELPGQLLHSMRVKIDEPEVKHFLNSDTNQNEITNYILNSLPDSVDSDSFKSFLVAHLKPQIQLCFGEGLKDPSNNNAWVAFQRMLLEDIQGSIDRIEAGQQEIKSSIEGMQTASGLTDAQMREISQLKELLKDKKLITMQIDESISNSLQTIEQKENELIKITTHTDIKVDQLKALTEKIHRQNRVTHIALLTGLVASCIVLFNVFYQSFNKPFTGTIQVYGWEGEQHNPLEGKGTLVLEFGNKTEQAEINRSGEAVFKKIDSRFNNQAIRVYLKDTEHKPYYLQAGTVHIKKNEVAKLMVLLEGLEKFEGYIYDEAGFGIPGTQVSIAGLNVHTDDRGYFHIAIPQGKQKEYQSVEVLKTGYMPYRNNAMPMTKDVFERVLIKE